jgi:hypothetical protein
LVAKPSSQAQLGGVQCACRLVGLSRDSYRNPPVVDEATQQLSAKIVEIAQVRRRFGYRSRP